jgi:uncharacterized protein (DUF111 family)
MRICYLDAFSGISGDMFVGALVDAGADCAAIRQGIEPESKLPLQVLFRGAPAPSLQVEFSWATVKMERCQDQSDAEWKSYWASLTFEVLRDARTPSNPRR